MKLLQLHLERIFTNDRYTIGHLYLIEGKNKKYLMDTIEDADRGLDDSMSEFEILSKKVKCETAIPTGTYDITLSVQSPSFSKKAYYKNFCNGYLPRLLKVKGFDGILIHRGATEEHSCGCLIVGQNKVKGKVINSQIEFEKIMTEYLQPAAAQHNVIKITISRKYSLS